MVGRGLVENRNGLFYLPNSFECCVELSKYLLYKQVSVTGSIHFITLAFGKAHPCHFSLDP